jgi:hypothetical protein
MFSRGSVGYGKVTQTANTIIQQLIRPFKHARTRIKELAYTAAGTAHTLTVRMSIGTTVLSAAAAASQAVIVLTAQPSSARNVAGNDYLVIEQFTAGKKQHWILVKVTSVVGLSITLTASLSVALPAGARVWLMSLDSDTILGQGSAPPTFTLAASVTTTLPSSVGGQSAGLATTPGNYEPMIVESNNATAAGTLERVMAEGVRLAA